jgi:protein O-mannosyl-transferase
MAKKKTNTSTNSQVSTTSEVIDSASKSKLFSISNIVLLALTIGLSLFIYSNVKNHKYVNWDDQVYITENPLLLDKNHTGLWSSVVSNNYHPITMKSLAMQYKSNDTKASTFIYFNVFLHILNSLLVFFLFNALSRGKPMIAGITALLFAIHPMHVESVVWVSERKDVLYVFFGLISTIAYLLFSQSSKKSWWVISFFAFALACGSKAMAVVFPLLFVLVDYINDKPILQLKTHINKLPFFILAFLTGLIALNVQSGGNFHGWLIGQEVTNSLGTAEAFSFLDKVKYAGFGLGQYFIKLFFPYQMAAYHPYPTDGSGVYFAGFGMLLAYLGITVWAYMSQRKLMFFGLAWMFISLLLVLQFISVGSALMADRYSYLPYAGITFALLMMLFEKVDSNKNYKNIVLGLIGIYALFLTFSAKSQVGIWQDSISLWDNVIKYYPNDAKSYTLRGTSWGKERNDLGKARADFEKAIKLNDKSADAYEGLGIVAGLQNDHSTAMQMLEKCHALNPQNGNFAFNLGVAYLKNKRATEAIPLIEKAMQLNARKKNEYIINYIQALTEIQAKAVQARAAINDAKQMGINNESISLCSAQLYLNEKNNPQAIIALKEALTFNPNNAGAKQMLEQLVGK